jgi:Fe2+ or Zn2+ uptake regulation protein
VSDDTQPDLEAACVDKGMRMTEQRRVIARVLQAATDHPDVEELYRRSSAVDPNISISTVYRTVKLFGTPASSSGTTSATGARATRRCRKSTTTILSI